MKFKTVLKAALLALSSIILSINLQAGDGYFSLAYGARNKGLAGAGIALYHVSLINGNPAGHSLLDKQFTVGVSLFSPIREYTITGTPSGLPTTFGLTPGTVESESNLFPIPYLAGNWRFGDNAFSVSLTGNGGMNTNYPTMTFFDQNIEATGVNLAQLLTNLTYSRRLSDKHSIGVTAVLAYQLFKAEGLSNFGNFSSDPAALTNNGNSSSVGFGFKVGYLGELVDGLSLGAMFQSEVVMSEFEEYQGLFAEQGDFDIPMSWTAGLSYAASEKLTLIFDVKQILYSGTASVNNPIDPMALPPAFLNPGGDPNNPMDYTPNPNHVPLGADNGSGFGWQDMTIFKAGFEYMANPDWTFRMGYSYGEQPIPSSEVVFNILAPGVVEHHIALGATKSLGEGKRLDFAFVHALSKTVSGFNPFDFDPQELANGNFVPNQTIDLKMHQFDFDISYTF